MKNTIKATILSTIAILGVTGVSNAGPADHSVTTKWSSDLTVSQNFNNAVVAVGKYCKTEARKIDRRDMSFRKRFTADCNTELLEDYVATTGSVEVEKLYTELKRKNRG